MNLRTRLRRWSIGADRYDRAIASIAVADNAEQQGRSNAHAFIRKVHAEYPNPARVCSVPDCCA